MYSGQQLTDDNKSLADLNLAKDSSISLLTKADPLEAVKKMDMSQFEQLPYFTETMAIMNQLATKADVVQYPAELPKFSNPQESLIIKEFNTGNWSLRIDFLILSVISGPPSNFSKMDQAAQGIAAGTEKLSPEFRDVVLNLAVGLGACKQSIDGSRNEVLLVLCVTCWQEICPQAAQDLVLNLFVCTIFKKIEKLAAAPLLSSLLGPIQEKMHKHKQELDPLLNNFQTRLDRGRAYMDTQDKLLAMLTEARNISEQKHVALSTHAVANVSELSLKSFKNLLELKDSFAPCEEEKKKVRAELSGPIQAAADDNLKIQQDNDADIRNRARLSAERDRAKAERAEQMKMLQHTMTELEAAKKVNLAKFMQLMKDEADRLNAENRTKATIVRIQQEDVLIDKHTKEQEEVLNVEKKKREERANDNNKRMQSLRGFQGNG